MSDELLMKTMRYMAWERAKGELRSMMQTYWGRDGHYEEMKKATEQFIEKIEFAGWHE